ncbi:MAG: Spore protein [Verrucomicrobiota bacterium]|jgi:HSP20 family protein
MFLTKYQTAPVSVGRLFNLHEELERLFETPVAATAQPWSPALDVTEDKDGFTVRAELPGLKREDINLSLHDGALILTGERKVETESTEATVHRRERFYGKFQRVLALPVAVNAEKVTAHFKDGVLAIVLPKSEAAKPKQIDVTLN